MHSRFQPFKTLTARFWRRCALLGLLILSHTHVPEIYAQTAQATQEAGAGAGEELPFVDVIPDPIEGFNRGAWAINKGLFRGVIYPLSFGYNFIVREPVRNHINKAGHNLAYPVRLVNNSLQGKWSGAWEETKRFGVNSTVGLGGLFDPATRWKIGRSDEDFGQTLGTWDVGPGFYLMIPLIGPSNGRDALGKVIDWPLDICFWIGVAYPHEIWPNGLRAGFSANAISGSAPAYNRQLNSVADPYATLRTLYSLNRQRLIIDYVPRRLGPSDPDPTTGAVLFKPLTPHFAEKEKTRSVVIASTGEKLKYSAWIQKKPAPVVYYIPGLGSYRLDRSTLAYADMLYRNGFSVVTFSNPFHRDFMQHASTVATPGYGPADCDDVVSVLKLIREDFEKRHPNHATASHLSGVSHGAYLTLMIAAREAAGRGSSLSFDRYVAVNPPVDLAAALEHLDEMFKAPLAWPAQERGERMKNAVYKALYFADNGLDISGDIPLTREESQFLIGLYFRNTLMGTIVESQTRHDLHVLKSDPKKFIRRDVYEEARKISYQEYMKQFVVPYFLKQNPGVTAASLVHAADLRSASQGMQQNTKVRVQICEDDFLLSKEDVDWFRSTFGERLLAYAVGGHLGNLHVPAVQKRLVKLFTDQ
ncbi:MAG TPA: VacJ family lipoprotein [Verrucomicrobiae bacterium]|nr:VacJ family lipoprotein [Verrucomicrobiae bacterium]